MMMKVIYQRTLPQPLHDSYLDRVGRQAIVTGCGSQRRFPWTAQQGRHQLTLVDQVPRSLRRRLGLGEGLPGCPVVWGRGGRNAVHEILRTPTNILR